MPRRTAFTPFLATLEYRISPATIVPAVHHAGDPPPEPEPPLPPHPGENPPIDYPLAPPSGPAGPGH